MTRLTHQRWTELDKQQLRELALLHVSDLPIAKIMRRTPSAVSWQRRFLRIRLSGKKREQFSAAGRSFNIVPISTNNRRFDVSRENQSAVDRLMQLASGIRRTA
jgi:hypothetical protein